MGNRISDQEIKEALKDWPVRFKAYARADRTKAIIQILNTFLPFLGLWVLMYLSLDWSYWLTLGLALINGVLLVRVFIIQHDCGHRSFFKSQQWNKIVGTTCSFFTTIPFKYWAREHDFHHAHSGQLETREIGDIWMLTVEEYRKASPMKRLFYRIYRMPVMTFIIGPIVYLLYNNRWPIVKLPGWQKIHRAMHWNNLLLVAVYAGLGWLLGWKNFFLVQIPVVVIFAITAVWFFYVQHQHEFTYKQWKENWDYLLSAIKGATYYKLPKWLNWMTGSIGYHHIHHLNSKIPNYHLAQCAEDNPDLQRYVTTVTFWESLKCMFNKLWDEQTERMITFREFYQRERTLAA
ncbi:MAG: fatty acid desaturase [Lewinella sp.]|nr:fatty acid desaturase [Lewinella sp.]